MQDFLFRACDKAIAESAKVSHKRVFALLTPEKPQLRSVFALPGCQWTSVNTLLCDTLGLAEQA